MKKGGAMNYNAYLQGEHWKLMRRLRREVDNEQCAVCGCKDKLNVHHKTYERIGAEKLGDLITLCYECHGKYHNKLGKGNFPVQQRSTVESFQKKEDLSNFKVEEDYSMLTVTNKTFDDYKLHLDGKVLGTIPNQRTVSSIKVPSGLREFVFKCGDKEKKKVETIKRSAQLDIVYSDDELKAFVKEVWDENIMTPLTEENKNLFNRILEIKEVLPLLEYSGIMNIKLNHLELIRLLRNKGYDINANTRYNETPMERWASSNCSEELYYFLLNNGAKPTERTLEAALKNSNKDIIISLLKHVELKPEFVYSVAENRNEGILELLIEKGIDINYKHLKLIHVIHHFINKKRWDIMDKLVTAGINKEVLTNQGETPFMLALKIWGDESRIMKLLDLGFSPLGTDRSGMTALSYACTLGYDRLVKRLLSNWNFNVNKVSRDGKAPLGYACNKPKLEVIELLLSKGANPNTKDNFGSVPLDIAVLYKNIPIAKTLIEHGSDVNNINSQGNTPLVTAVTSKNLEMVELLIDNGADPSIKTSKNIVELAKLLKLNEILELIK